MSNEATNTSIDASWSSFQLGQVTLVRSSWYDSSMYVLMFAIVGLFARVAGLEPAANGFGDRYSTN